mmetsp:Transcript_9416/g.19475  ORF Transcript_9416/g.19475 Transcript_9416/m.19475 type:complete len:224 (-) Transcript_9416:5804-6475(-)
MIQTKCEAATMIAQLAAQPPTPLEARSENGRGAQMSILGTRSTHSRSKSSLPPSVASTRLFSSKYSGSPRMAAVTTVSPVHAPPAATGCLRTLRHSTLWLAPGASLRALCCAPSTCSSLVNTSTSAAPRVSIRRTPRSSVRTALSALAAASYASTYEKVPLRSVLTASALDRCTSGPGIAAPAPAAATATSAMESGAVGSARALPPTFTFTGAAAGWGKTMGQ